MDNFNLIYKILSYLEKGLDFFEFDYSQFTAKAFKVSDERFEKLLIMLQSEGYIEGLYIRSFLSDNGYDRIKGDICPKITLKGLEYLHENSLMKKAAGLAKGVIDVIT